MENWRTGEHSYKFAIEFILCGEMNVFFKKNTLVLNLVEHNREIGVQHVDFHLNSLIEVLICEFCIYIHIHVLVTDDLKGQPLLMSLTSTRPGYNSLG